MGYTGKIIKGVSWIAAIRVVTRVLSFIKTLVIARILSPNDFGLFGIATLVLTFVEIFTETGVNVFLVQEKEYTDHYISTAWSVSILRGLIIAVVIASTSVLVAAFFRAPLASQLLLFISLVPLARGFINPSIVKFQKELLFNKEFYYRTSIFLVEVIVTSVLVILTHNVYSLIFGLLISVVFEIIISFMIIGPRPSLSFDLEKFKKVIGYGKWITASTILNYFYQHGDDIAVGRLLGTASLGTYDMAYRISLIPLSDIGDVVARVTFPVYVKIADDLERLRRAFIRSALSVLILVSPIGIVLFFFPQEIIQLVLGEKWLPAADVLRVLAIFGIIRALSVFMSTFFLSIKKPQIFTLISVVGLSGLAITIVPFIMRWGIVGAGYSALLGTSVTIPVLIYFLYKVLYLHEEKIA